MAKKVKMNFISDLHLACSNDDMRPTLACIHFYGGYAYASNAHMLVKQPLSLSSIENVEALEGKAIHKDIFKAIRRTNYVKATEEGVECTDKNGAKIFFEYAKDVTPLNYDAVIPTDKTHEEVLNIGVNPVLFGLLPKVMAGGGQVKLTFNGQSSAILVHPKVEGYGDELAIIMPMSLYK